METEANDGHVTKILEIEKRHFKKYGSRKMTPKELNGLCRI